MVRSSYPYLILQRHRWFVRIVVPPDVRDLMGKAVFKIATGKTDQHRAAAVAAPILAGIRRRIEHARENDKRLALPGHFRIQGRPEFAPAMRTSDWRSEMREQPPHDGAA